MPVSPRGDPFSATSKKAATRKLLVPQARVLRSLMPANPSDLRCDWPVHTRAALGIEAGYTAISGSVTRALNGIREGSSSGDAQTGLLALGYVEEFPIDICGLIEVNYRITAAGIRAYTAYIADRGSLPPVRDALKSTNTTRGYRPGRYRQGEARFQ